jgi:hypothetical protein
MANEVAAELVVAELTRPAGPATAAIVPQSLRSIGGFSQQLAWWLGTLQYLLAT